MLPAAYSPIRPQSADLHSLAENLPTELAEAERPSGPDESTAAEQPSAQGSYPTPWMSIRTVKRAREMSNRQCFAFAKAVTKHKRIASEIRQLPRRGLRRSLIDRHLRIKEAELARYHAEVTEWEQREYFELF